MAINSNAWNRLRYTAYAPVYDLVASFRGARQRSLAMLDPRAGERVLIDGCGTGADIPLLPAGLELAAIDITPAMVRRTQQRAEELGIAIDARVMDAQRLDYHDASFDAIILHLIVAVVPDPLATL